MKFLRTIDFHFKVEVALFLSSIGSNSEARFTESVLQCPLSQDSPKNISASLLDLGGFGESKLFNFCSTALQNQFAVIRGYVQALQDKRCPKFGADLQNGFQEKVKKSMAMFLEHEESGASGASTAPKAYRKEAMTKKFIMFIVGYPKEGRSKTTSSSLLVFHQFKWLLTSSQLKEIEKLTDEMMEPGVAGVGAEEPAEKKGRQGSAAKDARAIVGDLYQ